jgi:glutamyl-tRNA reductase
LVEPTNSLPPSLRLLVVGLNHRTAPLALRETVSFNPAQAVAATHQFHQRFPQAELVILSTCNRVELYIARPVASEPTLEGVAGFLAEYHALQREQLQGHLYHREDREMIEHLFAVTSSLDSMVIGETQILSQVKHAYLHGCGPGPKDASAGPSGAEPGGGGGGGGGGVGKVLHALFQKALAAAKDVHEKTKLSSGHLSVASVAVDLAASVFDRFDDKTVLCVGAGKMATLMLRHLAELKPRKLLLTNRSPERAEALAAQLSTHGTAAVARPFEQLDALLAEADILLTSTGAVSPIITEARFKAVLKPRRYRPIVMVDIAVPRDIEADVAKLSNVYLYNIDDLQEVAAGNRGKRDQEIAAARQLLAGHMEEFLRWFAARDVGPLVKALYDQANVIARAELEAHFAKHPDMPPEHRQELERLTHRVIGKLLHSPVTQLTSRAEATARPMLAAALRRLFDIGEQPPQSH